METELAPRPRPALPFTLADRFFAATALLLLLAFLVTAIAGWNALPDRVPMHFGPNGQPDAWGSRAATLLGLAIAIVIYAVLTALERVPHLFNYPWPITEANAERQYRHARRFLLVLKNLLILLFFAIYAGIWATAVSTRNGLPSWFLIVAMSALCGAIAVYVIIAARAR